MASSPIQYWSYIALVALAFHLLAALPPMIVWWVSRLRVWVGWKILVAIVATLPTAVFLFWSLYVSVVAAPVLPGVWLLFALIIWGVTRVLRRYPASVSEG